MLVGLGLAVTAALVTGVAQVSMTTLSRRIGTTVTSSLVLMASLFWILPLVVGHTLPDSAAWWMRVLALGAANGAAFLVAVEAFRLGPLTRVGPIAATSSIVTVIMAALLLGETLPPVAWVAAPIAAVGAVLCVMSRSVVQVRGWGSERGPLLMVGSVVLIGLFTVGFRDPTREAGWAPAVLVGRLATVGTVVAVLGIQAVRARRTILPTMGLASEYLRPSLAAAAIGLLVSIAQVLILASLEVGPAWVTGAAMAVSTGTIVVAGMVLFRERPTRQQWTGIAAITVALALLTIQLALTSQESRVG